MKYVVALFILVACCAICKGQTLHIGNDTLRWTISQVHDLKNDSTFSYSSEFITTTNTIRWLQKNETYTTSFDIQSVTGTWVDAEQDGFNVYSVLFDTKQGTIRIEKSGNHTDVIFNFPENGENTMPYSFHVTGIQKQ